MKQLISTVVYTLAVLGGVFTIVTVIYMAQANDQPVKALTDFERRTFLENCVFTPDMKAYCQCTLDHLELNYSAPKIREIAGRTTDNNVPDELWEAVQSCLHLVNVEEL